jgi:nitroreductase
MSEASGFYEAVASRRAVRAFLPDPIPEEVMDRCLDAALLAPSSSNLQPWEFVLIRSEAARATASRICFDQAPARSAPLLLAVVAHRDSWRRNRDEVLRIHQSRGKVRRSLRRYYQKLIPLVYRTGPFGLAGWAKRALSRVASLFRPAPNMHSESDIRVLVHKSTALAAATLMLALRAEGYDSCPIEGFDPWRARKLLKLKRGAEVCMFLAVGKRAEGGVWWERALVPREWVVRTL